jgi:uncharacterized protein (DUF2147 family)
MLVKKILLICLLTITQNSLSQDAEDILGYWSTEEDKGTIEITKSQKGYRGKLVWVDVVHRGEETIDTVLDKENPDPRLRKKSVVGLTIFKNFKFDPEDRDWVNGRIYDPESGNTYSSKMWFEEGNKEVLFIRGYIGISLFGRTTQWRRSKTKVPRSYLPGGSNYIKYKLGSK